MIIDWTQFKNFITNRKSDILMLQDSTTYYLFSSENNLSIECQLYKTPTDTTDLDDFEDNYLSLCNPKKIEIVTPTIPLNIAEMKPYGLCHAHIDSSDNYIYDITLSDKDEEDYTYSCSVSPEEYDCVCTSNTDALDEVESVDLQNFKIETFQGRLPNGSHKLIKPKIIDFKFPSNNPLYQLWGIFVHVENFGDDDHVCLQLIDIENKLGYGNNFVLKEYDEVWCKSINKSTSPFFTPDGAPGNIPSDIYGRILYYPKDVTKTDIKFWGDYILTVES